ncbi:hypothetical protein DQ04_09071010 [Trypanosoma grayi]|uniref:hypothetical protein n=1 Tax=Trypanosoma grayi TaxID=71804 RepID=UPI0004F44B17|nr:hypothetical protein DQ04_09071010 [Trypanosoma grayi]KEG07690.1 hypothetical protein DQ04_09071010 [Trypanosoma grayi]
MKEEESALERAKRGELAARGAQAALQMAKEAAEGAMQAVEEAVKQAVKEVAKEVQLNADAENSVARKSLNTATIVTNAAAVLLLPNPSSSGAQPTGVSDTTVKLKTKAQEVKEVQKAKEESTKLLQSAAKIKLEAEGPLQKAKDAVFKAEEALQMFRWAEANATDADQHVKKAVEAAKAGATAAKDVAYNCFVQVERAYNASLAVGRSVNETDTAAREAHSVAEKLDKNEITAEWVKTLIGAYRKAQPAREAFYIAVSVFRDVQTFGNKAAESADVTLASIEGQLRTAATGVDKSVSAGSRAEAVLKEARQELKQLQEQAGKSGAPETKEEQQEQGSVMRDEHSLPPQSEGGAAVAPGKKDGSRPSATEATTVPGADADATPALASNTDGSSNPALVYAPLLLLPVCVSLW